MATNPLQSALKPIASTETPADDAYAMAMQQLMNKLESRQNRGYNPTLLAIAEGMLTPTATGSFGESIGQTAKSVRTQQDQESRREQENAMMRFQLAKENMGVQKERQKQQLMGQLYKETPEGFVLDTEKAKELARVTGDPQYIQQIISSEKQTKMRQLGEQMFVPKTVETDGVKKTTYEFNPNAVFDLAKISDNPVEAVAKYAEMVPKLRKAGLLGGGTTEATPFDAIALMATDPAIKLQAQNLAKQFAKGSMDEDKANTLANQMLTMMTSHMDRQQAMQFNQAMQGIMLGLRKDQMDFNQMMVREKLEKEKKEQESKLTDQQKIEYNKVIVPIINEGIKASTALAQVGQLKNQIEKAPSGVLSGVYASSVGRLLGTDENTAMRNLDSLSKALIPMIPRLPGSSSNLDAQNLEKSIGRLTDSTLTNKQRREIVIEIEDGFKRLSDRAEQYQNHWDSTKTLPKISSAPQESPKPAPQKPSQPSTGGFKILGVEKP
jgi:hypothetical protein